MTITIQSLLDRGYIQPDNDPRNLKSAYRWTGLGQVNCAIWQTPEQYAHSLTMGRIRHCIHCLRSMYCKPAGEKDPARSWRVVCRGCYADGKRLEEGV